MHKWLTWQIKAGFWKREGPFTNIGAVRVPERLWPENSSRQGNFLEVSIGAHLSPLVLRNRQKNWNRRVQPVLANRIARPAASRPLVPARTAVAVKERPANNSYL